MSGAYSPEHDSALADIKAAGGQFVTFTRTRQTYTPATDSTGAPTITTVTGYVLQVRGEPERYLALQLIETDAPTLLFVPTIYGAQLEPGDTVVWNGSSWTIRELTQNTAPDGVIILQRVIIAQ